MAENICLYFLNIYMLSSSYKDDLDCFLFNLYEFGKLSECRFKFLKTCSRNDGFLFNLCSIARTFVSISFLLGTCLKAYSQSPVIFMSRSIGTIWFIFRFFFEPGAHSRYLSSGNFAILMPSLLALANDSGSLFT